MFGISFGEFFVIFIIALVVIGPQKLPETIRTVGSLIHKLRSFADQVKTDVSKEFQVDDLKNSFLETKNNLTNQIKDTAHLDDVKKSLNEARHATESSMRESQQAINQSIQSDKPHITNDVDHESHSDIADYYYVDDEMTEPPKNYNASVHVQTYIIDPEDEETFKTICQARQFELYSHNEKEHLLSYQLKYSKPRELNDLSSAIDRYYDTLIELNHS